MKKLFQIPLPVILTAAIILSLLGSNGCSRSEVMDEGILQSLPSPQAAVTTLLSSWAYTKPTIDGIVSDSEWGDATGMTFILEFVKYVDNVRLSEQHDCILYVKNDNKSLYLFIIVKSEEYDTGTRGDYLSVKFDNDNVGDNFAVGDDYFFVRGDGRLSYDGYYRGSGWGPDPSNVTINTNNGMGAVTHTNQHGTGDYIFEISKPLNTADNDHDFSLFPGDTVGLLIFYNDGASSSAFWPAGGPKTRGVAATCISLVMAESPQ